MIRGDRCGPRTRSCPPGWPAIIRWRKPARRAGDPPREARTVGRISSSESTSSSPSLCETHAAHWSTRSWAQGGLDPAGREAAGEHPEGSAGRNSCSSSPALGQPTNGVIDRGADRAHGQKQRQKREPDHISSDDPSVPSGEALNRPQLAATAGLRLLRWRS